MLGKHWLNRYESIDMRGSAIERSQHRQRKLGGIIRWYFDHVMESLPLMLQAALLLLGCALSRYLWQIDVIVASVVLGVTSFGVIFYLFVIIAGSASESCPYQTPVAPMFRHILRYLHLHLLPTLRSAPVVISFFVSSSLSHLSLVSSCYSGPSDWWSNMQRPWYSTNNLINILLIPVFLFASLAHDVYYLGRSILRLLAAFCKVVYRQFTSSRRTTYRWFVDISSLRTPGPCPQTVTMDLRCISWILQTSLDKAVHLSAFKHLISMPELARFDPTLVFDCFNIFTRCISIRDGRVVTMQGLEQLATASAGGLFRTLHHLATTDPTSSILTDLQHHYNEFFPSELDFTSLPFRSTMTKIHALAGRFGNPRDIRWYNYPMSIQEHIPFARRMVQAAQESYQQSRGKKVPRWILRSTLYFLSLCPISPPSIIVDCLTIVAIDLNCDVSNFVISDERYVQV